MAKDSICTFDRCRNPVKARGLCRLHYRRSQRGSPMDAPLRSSAARNAKPAFIKDVVVPYAGDDCLAWPFPHKGTGYPIMNENGRSVSVTRHVCCAVHGEPPSNIHQAAHSCGNGHLGCVNPRHLRWATPQDNWNDMRLHGTARIGDEHPQAKLTAAKAAEIRSLRGRMTRPAIAARFGVSKSQIDRILSGKHWAQGRDEGGFATDSGQRGQQGRSGPS